MNFKQLYFLWGNYNITSLSIFMAKEYIKYLYNKEVSKKFVFNNCVTKPIIEAFKLLCIRTLFCNKKNGNQFF